MCFAVAWTWQSTCSVCLSVCLSVPLSVPFVCLNVCLSVSPSVRLPVYVNARVHVGIRVGECICVCMQMSARVVLFRRKRNTSRPRRRCKAHIALELEAKFSAALTFRNFPSRTPTNCDIRPTDLGCKLSCDTDPTSHQSQRGWL